MAKNVEVVVSGKKLKLETGSMARQADGSVLVALEETVILASAVVGAERDDMINADFVPLTVDYREKTYAAGKIPGGFFKREGRPREKEILTSRLIDRSIRPLFPKNWRRDIVVQIMVLSSDGENDSNIPALIGASAALMISSIPFKGPVGAVNVGLINNEFVINPTFEQEKETFLDMVVVGKDDSILMVESGSKELEEKVLIDALSAAHEEIKKICDVQRDLAEGISKEKLPISEIAIENEVAAKVQELMKNSAKEFVLIKEKSKRKAAEEEIVKNVSEALKEVFPESEKLIKKCIQNVLSSELRKHMLEKNVRADGRKMDEIRKITIDLGILPRTHGSALFTRGETQSLATVTLGTSHDMQIMDDLEGEYKERFMLHYNFPGFATGEAKVDRGPGRREIGHGSLAKKALYPVFPTDEDFPYTIRVVSDILESNGSSSMASVCGGSLALFDAGVPLTSAVAGIAMGLIIEGDRYKILTDIMGMEDHFGDMDLKAAGTKNGLTALQMDIKVAGIPIKIIQETLEKAKDARLRILDTMNAALKTPRAEMSAYAPRIITITIPQDKIGALIGPGGKNIRKIIEQSQAEIEVDDDGRVFISSDNNEKLMHGKELVEFYTAEAEVGKVYKGKVARLVKFGAFVEILPGKDGLLHISQISNKRIDKVEDIFSEGDEVEVLVQEIDNQGRINLTCKGINKETIKK
ncbi:MAG: polyribonucleotide nucleotidyltransferase [bacterium]